MYNQNRIHFENTEALMLQQLLRPLIIAHRGIPKLAPENTVPSFKKALEFMPDLVELDYHATKDGKMVVLHDFCLDRTTNACKKWGPGLSDISVTSRTLKEIKTLDAGSWFHGGLPEFFDTKIPTLKEAMDVIQQTSFTLIERKAGEPRDLVRFLKKEGWIANVVVQSFDWDFIRELATFSSAITLGMLGPPEKYLGHVLAKEEKWLNADFIDEISECPGVRYVVWNNQVTAESIALAHEKDLRVLIYTIDNPDEAERLVKLGADGIITNEMQTIAKRLRK